MTISNWIELAVIGFVCLTGSLIKLRSHKKVSDIEVSIGAVKKSECPGNVIGVHE